MKKTKIYFIVPLVTLLIFFGYYWKFSSEYESKQAAIVAAEKQRKLDKIKADNDLRLKAIEEANAAQAQRKLERKQRDEKERQQREDKENARLAMEKADQDAQKLERQAERLKKEVKEAGEEIAKLQAEKQRSIDEDAHIKTLVTKAEENVAKLDDVVKKIEVADAAAARAAALAAAKKE
jgi:hypothetical protein